MRISLAKSFIFFVLFLGLIMLSGCGADQAKSADGNIPVEASSSETMFSQAINTPIDPDDFIVVENVEGLSVMTGTLSPGVTMNAQIYCERDLANPGTASVDVGSLRHFSPDDVDLLLNDSWTITSDTVDVFERNGTSHDYRTAIYEEDNQEVGKAANTTYSLTFIADGWAAPKRIPWFSEEFSWSTGDFSFGSQEQMFDIFCARAAFCGIELSEVYQTDRVPAEVFEAYYRLRISHGEAVPDMEWSDDDNAYMLVAAQKWNGLPICTSGLNLAFDGESLDNEAYRIMFHTDISAIVTANGIKNMQLNYIYDVVSRGDDQNIVTFWEALEVFKAHLEHPKYPGEILYRLSSSPDRELIIDQVTLCYVPIWQGEVESDEEAPYDMIPCWTFRVIGYDEQGLMQAFTGVVNGVTGEYILQTNMSASI